MKKYPSITKEVWILSFVLLITIIFFWSGSRYPQLNEKGSGAGQEMLSDKLTDRPVFIIENESPLWKRVVLSTANWLETNKLGMAFGLILAAICLSLLNYIKMPKFNNPFLNTVCGTFTGAPLGICVNCAAPVAKGLFKGGVNGTFALAMMFSSPKFNVVIFTMVISLFPFYLVIIKYLFTLIFIFIFLPLLVRQTLPDKKATKHFEDKEDEKKKDNSNWGKAGANVLMVLWINLVYIIKKVVPFMILAGILGALVSQLTSITPFIGGEMTLWKVTLLSAITLFLPMPIGVDILLAELLSSSGVLAGYVSISLFSLGIFSVYSFLIVWNYFSKKLALLITISLFLLSILSGYTADYFFQKQNHDAIKYYKTALHSIVKKKFPSAKQKTPIIKSNQSIPKSDRYSHNNLTIHQYKHNSRSKEKNSIKLFSKYHGSSFGIKEEFICPDELWEPFFYGRGMASGDFNNDGWTDIILGRRKGVSFYTGNTKGFTAFNIDLGFIDSLDILVTTLVDVDNNGFLDLFISTYDTGNYFILNDNGNFQNARIIDVPKHENAITMAISFTDLNNDSWIDFYLGNWGFGSYTRYKNPNRYTANSLVYNNNLNFESVQIEKGSAETLTVLFSDFNNDNKMDLLIGNDFKPADEYFIGTEDGLKRTFLKDSMFRVSPYYTMSITTADVNNDLLLDTYTAGLNFNGPEIISKEIEYDDNTYLQTFCSGYENKEKYNQCIEIMNLRTIIPRRDPVLVKLENCDLLKKNPDLFRQ